MGAIFFLFYLAIAIAIAGPFVFIFAFYKWWRNRSIREIGLLIIAGLLLSFSYLCYDAFYPSDSFYKEEFVRMLGFPLPASASIEEKESSFPDNHGAYSACAIISVSVSDFKSLAQRVKSSHDLSLVNGPNPILYTYRFEAITNRFPSSDFLYRFEGSNYKNKIRGYAFVGFLTDQKTIIIYRTNS